MIIRNFKPQDIKRVLEIEKMSFKDPYPSGILLDIYNIGAGFLVAQKDNLIVGYIIFWVRFENEGHIISLAVDKKYRRRGIGTMLLISAIQIFKRYGIKDIKLEVRITNRGAREFYKNIGFREEKVIKNYYEDGEDVVIMEKTLQ